MDESTGQTRGPGVEKTHRTPPSRTQRAPPGVKTRIAHTRLTLASLLHRIYSLALTCIATHAAFLLPFDTRFLRLSGIRSLYANHEPATIRLCWPSAGIRSPPDALRHEHDNDHEHEHEHEHEHSATIRLC